MWNEKQRCNLLNTHVNLDAFFLLPKFELVLQLHFRTMVRVAQRSSIYSPRPHWSNASHALFHRNSFVGLYLHGWFFVDNDLKSGLSPIFIYRTRNNFSVPMVYFTKLFIVFEFEGFCVHDLMNQEMNFILFPSMQQVVSFND